jgi:hypothetical protein
MAMKLILDIYSEGCEPTPDEVIECRSTREGISMARKRAARVLSDYGHEGEKIVRVYPDDDDIASFGFPGSSDYVTLRRREDVS